MIDQKDIQKVIDSWRKEASALEQDPAGKYLVTAREMLRAHAFQLQYILNDASVVLATPIPTFGVFIRSQITHFEERSTDLPDEYYTQQGALEAAIQHRPDLVARGLYVVKPL